MHSKLFGFVGVEYLSVGGNLVVSFLLTAYL